MVRAWYRNGDGNGECPISVLPFGPDTFGQYSCYGVYDLLLEIVSTIAETQHTGGMCQRAHTEHGAKASAVSTPMSGELKEFRV